jgi:hypothetical protein
MCMQMLKWVYLAWKLTLILMAMELKSPILENGNKSCMTDTENVLKIKIA